MPNAITLLEQDHRTVEQLFEQFESTQDPQVALQICQELTIHAQVEEEIVYPALAEIDQELEQEAKREHAEAKELIAQIQSTAASAGDLSALVSQLKEAIEHHVQEEESEAFPKMRDRAGDELEDLGTQIDDLKQELLASGAEGAGGDA